MCSFPQRIQDVVDELPRVPENVTIVKVVRTTVNQGGEASIKSFKVRRQKVLQALVWLKKHNKEYADISICEDNLNWIPANEEISDLPISGQNSVNLIDFEDAKDGHTEDNGPTQEPNQCNTEGSFGMLRNSFITEIKNKDIQIANEINECIEKSKQKGQGNKCNVSQI